jgi:hypothetical protein
MKAKDQLNTPNPILLRSIGTPYILPMAKAKKLNSGDVGNLGQMGGCVIMVLRFLGTW